MSERVTDEYIDHRLHVIRTDRPRVTSMEASQEEALLVELQHHRARIAAHAAAHPERLSEWSLAFAQHNVPAMSPVGFGEAVDAMVSEIKQRRAADLTPEQIEALRFARSAVTFYGQAFTCTATAAEIDGARAAINDILRAHGATP